MLAALHPALGGWGGGARGMGEQLVAPHDFTAAQLQLLSGSFTSSVLAGWPASAGGADQVMQLLLSHGGAQPWAAQPTAAHAAAGGLGTSHPYFQHAGPGAVPAGLLHPATAYSQLQPSAAAPGAWPMSELFAPLGPPGGVFEDGGAATEPPPSGAYDGDDGAPPAAG